MVFIALISFLMIILNPSRGSFNHAVFDSNSSPITENQEILKSIRDVNIRDYKDDYHPFIKRRNYTLYSIYDIRISDDKVYHVLGIFGTFKLLN